MKNFFKPLRSISNFSNNYLNISNSKFIINSKIFYKNITYDKIIDYNRKDLESELITITKEMMRNFDLNIDIKTDLTQYGLDSFDIMDILARSEEYFGLEFKDDDLDKFTTLNDIVNYIIKEKNIKE